MSPALLLDGSQVVLRPYRTADRPAVRALIQGLSSASRLRRFHGAVLRLSEDLLDRVVSGHTIVAERHGRIVGLANFIPLRDPSAAEVAFSVEDAQQGLGIGTLLFERLAIDARQEGVTRFLALVMATNDQMIDVLRGLGFEMTRRMDSGEIEYEIALRPWPEATRRSDVRLRGSAA